MGLEIGPATRQDFLDYAGALPPYRVKAWSARLDGRVIGIGGILFLPDGGRYAFVDISDEARKYPKALHQTGLRFMREVRDSNMGTVVATTTTGVPRANEWLERLGFVGHDVGGMRVFIHGGQSEPLP